MPLSKAQEVRKYFELHPKPEGKSDYFARVARELNTTHEYVKQLYYNNKEVIETPTIDESLAERKKDAKISELKKLNEELIIRLEEAESRFDALLNIRQDVELNEIKEIKSKSVHESVPIISISDIHFEETVEKDVVNNLNEYSPAIAKERLRNVFSNSMKLVRMFEKNTKINTVVIALLGDNITGYIHEELVESNSLSPTEATIQATSALMEGIKMFADAGFKVIVPCARGNHGRTTGKKRFSTGYKNSYEWMMYQYMSEIFRVMGYKNIEFVISKSEFTYLNILGKVNRFCHGDHFKFQGGIGGIFPSMFKFLHRINETIKADCTFMGHWHQYYAAARKGFVINGSVIGLNAYGMNFGNDLPVQNIQLIDSKYGYTGNFPIVV